jgi:hypothetical protein
MVGRMEVHLSSLGSQDISHADVIDVAVGQEERTDVGSLPPDELENAVQLLAVLWEPRVDKSQSVIGINHIPVDIAGTGSPDAWNDLCHVHPMTSSSVWSSAGHGHRPGLRVFAMMSSV